MQLTARRPKIMVSADGTGIASQAGGLLLTQALRVTGLDRGLDAALERWRPARAVHGPGKIITDLAVIDVTPEGLQLRETAPGFTPEEVQEHTEPKLRCQGSVPIMRLS